VQSGSPAILSLRSNPDAGEVNGIAAIELLTRRHVPLMEAKRAIEAVPAEGSHDLDVPTVEDPERLRAELQSVGLLVRVAPAPRHAIDVNPLRERLGTS